MSELRVLALDTSTVPCCGAVAIGASVRVSPSVAVLDNPRELSGRVISLVDEALSRAGWTLDDVQLLAVGLGPGSWTGLRVGLSAMKTLAQARDLPICGVGTFDAVRNAAQENGLSSFPPGQATTAIVGESRPGEMYCSIAGETSTESARVEVKSLPSFGQELRALNGPLLLAGLDERVLQDAAASAWQGEPRAELRVLRVSETRLIAGLARLSAFRLLRGQTDDPLRIEPLYLAASNAERVREAKLQAEAQNS